MDFKYKTNDYGKLIYLPVEKTTTNKSIFYIHDLYDEPESFEPFIEQLKMFNFYGIFFDTDQVEEKYDSNNGISFKTMYSKIRDVIISLNLDEVYLIGTGVGATIALLLSQDLKINIIKLILINPYTSKTSQHTRKILKNIPENFDQSYEFLKLMYTEEDEIFSRKKESAGIIYTSRKIIYNYYAYKEIINYITSEEFLKILRVKEKSFTTPTLIFNSARDHFLLSTEIQSTYRNSDNSTTIDLLSSGHYPWRDEPEMLIDEIMKFLFTGEKFYNKKTLPSEYLYKYLQDDIKDEYIDKFSEKIIKREEEALEREIKANEEVNMTDSVMSKEEIAYHMNSQSEILTNVISEAQQKVEEIKNSNKENDDESFITFDRSFKDNIIYQTIEGYDAYHDGMENNFYRKPNTTKWIPSKLNKKENTDN